MHIYEDNAFFIHLCLLLVLCCMVLHAKMLENIVNLTHLLRKIKRNLFSAVLYTFNFVAKSRAFACNFYLEDAMPMHFSVFSSPGG